MTFLVFLTFAVGALASLGTVRAADRHRRWTLAMAERRRRRLADALSALDRDAWEGGGDRGPEPGSDPAPEARAPEPTGARPRRIVLRVKE